MSNKNLLCDDCQKLGYCVLSIKITIPEKQLTDREIANRVPVRTIDRDAFGKFGKKLQEAHDLFHQMEYEQASYLYRDMLTTHNNSDEVKIGLVASLYFMEHYDEAASKAIDIDGAYQNDFRDALINLCIMKLKAAKTEIDKAATTTNTTKRKKIAVPCIS